MEKDLEEFLSAFGYACEKADRPFLTYAIEKAEQGICHFCNLTKIPIELKEVVLSRAAGEFLLWKQSMGKLEHINVSESVLKSIQVGDTTTTFAVKEQEGNNMDLYIQYLLHSGEEELFAYRRIVW